jgi:hypothetical protein
MRRAAEISNIVSAVVAVILLVKEFGPKDNGGGSSVNWTSVAIVLFSSLALASSFVVLSIARREAKTSLPTARPVAAVQVVATKKPKLVCVEACVRLVEPLSDGGFREFMMTSTDDRQNYSAAVASFRNVPTMTTAMATAVDAHITFFDTEGESQRIHHGCWLGEDSASIVPWLVGDTHELVIAIAYDSYVIAIEDGRDSARGLGTSPRPLDSDVDFLRVVVELVITGDRDELVAAPRFEFDLVLRPTLKIRQRQT